MLSDDDAKARVLYREWVDLQDINSNRFPAWHELPLDTRNAWRRKAAVGEMPAPADEPPGSGDSPAASETVATIAGVSETLQERGSRYGDFTENAVISQQLKQLIMYENNGKFREGYRRCSFVQREALEMIAQKIARILNGDPNYKDNWHDIQGYARLAEERCNEK